MRRPAGAERSRGQVPLAEYGRLYLLLFCVTILSLTASEAPMVLAAVSGTTATATVVSPAFTLLGTVLLAFVYVTTRDLDVALGGPSGRPDASLAVVVLAPVGVVALAGLATLALDTSVQSLLGGSVYVGARPTLDGLVWNALVPSVLTGVGFGVLFIGVVQTALREHVTPAGGVAVVTVLGALYASAAGSTLAGYVGSLVVAFAVGTAAVVALGAAVGAGWQAADVTPDRSLAVAGVAGVGVVAAVTGLWYLLATVPGRSFVGGPVGLAVAFAAAAVAHERWRSAPLSVLVVVAYLAAVDVAVYLQALAGVGP